MFNFAPGINVLLGANSSGMSTVLEAISFAEFQNTPHRSILNCPEVDQLAIGNSISELRFSATSSEIQSLVGADQAFNLGLRVLEQGPKSEPAENIENRLLHEALTLNFRNSDPVSI